GGDRPRRRGGARGGRAGAPRHRRPRRDAAKAGRPPGDGAAAPQAADAGDPPDGPRRGGRARQRPEAGSGRLRRQAVLAGRAGGPGRRRAPTAGGVGRRQRRAARVRRHHHRRGRPHLHGARPVAAWPVAAAITGALLVAMDQPAGAIVELLAVLVVIAIAWLAITHVMTLRAVAGSLRRHYAAGVLGAVGLVMVSALAGTRLM